MRVLADLLYMKTKRKMTESSVVLDQESSQDPKGLMPLRSCAQVPKRPPRMQRHGTEPVEDKSKQGKTIAGEPGCDITQSKYTEQTLHESEERYRWLVESSPDAIVLYSQGRIVLTNVAGAQLLGAANPQQVIGKPLLDFAHPDYQQLHKEQMRQVVEEGKTVPFAEEKLVRLDGTEVDVEVAASPLTYQGRPAVEVVIRDITEHKRAKEAIQRRDRYLTGLNTGIEALLRSLPEISYDAFLGALGHASGASRVYVFLNHRDPDGELRISERVEWCAEGIESKFNNALIQPATYLEACPRWKEVLSRGEAICECVSDLPKDEQANLELHSTKAILILPVTIEDEFTGFIGFDNCIEEHCWEPDEVECLYAAAADLTQALKHKLMEERLQKTHKELEKRVEERTRELAKANEQLRLDITQRERIQRQEREHRDQITHAAKISTVEEMASGLAHELNQPLCAIANCANAAVRMMSDRKYNNHDILEAIQEVATQAERAGKIIRRIRKLVRKQRTQATKVNIENIIKETISLIETNEQMEGITIRQIKPTEKIPMCFGNPIEIEQVLLNLIRNSCDAVTDIREGKRKITISVTTNGNEAVEVAVSDTGKGLPAECTDKLFQPFFTTKDHGLGIGLSISRSIIETHGGQLWAEANCDGGATFRFTLPLKGDVYD